MEFRRSWSWLTALALLGGPQLTAMGAQDELVGLEAAADAVYLGEILLSRGVKDDDGVLRTRVVLKVQEPLKGDARTGERVTFVTPGGRVEGEIAAVPGSDPFQPEEQVLLFLREGDGGRLEILGLYEGRFALHPNPRTGEPMLIGFELGGKGLVPSSARTLADALRALDG